MTLPSEPDDHSADALAERLFEASLNTFDIFAVYVGDRLDYYATLSAHGPLTSHELATRSGTEERYTREWLEHQAVSGILTVDTHTPTDQGRSPSRTVTQKPSPAS